MPLEYFNGGPLGKLVGSNRYRDTTSQNLARGRPSSATKRPKGWPRSEYHVDAFSLLLSSSSMDMPLILSDQIAGSTFQETQLPPIFNKCTLEAALGGQDQSHPLSFLLSNSFAMFTLTSRLLFVVASVLTVADIVKAETHTVIFDNRSATVTPSSQNYSSFPSPDVALVLYVLTRP